MSGVEVDDGGLFVTVARTDFQATSQVGNLKTLREEASSGVLMSYQGSRPDVRRMNSWYRMMEKSVKGNVLIRDCNHIVFYFCLGFCVL